ncbi:hypothetical protein KEM48_011580 [Puccinia striiformis f. sp. tritici PST-130]|nr:hypothetical protein KEM48_011580 [Puccinia striiformis f. sp. tritici PST-130]
MSNFRSNGTLLSLLWVMAITVGFALGASVGQAESGKGRYKALGYGWALWAGNAMSLALTELRRFWEGLTELYLSDNQITLTNSASLLSLSSHPNLAPIHLTTLHLSACSPNLSVEVSRALWLQDTTRSGYLKWLAVNGDNWGTKGCQRIVWALARRGGNSNLLRLEMLACDTPTLDTTIPPREEEVEDGQLEIDRLVKLLGF